MKYFMKNSFMNYEIVKLAKEKGFSNKVNNAEGIYYAEDILEDNKAYYLWICLVQKWLREEHHLIVIVAYQYEHDSTPYSYWIYKENNSLPLNQWINDLKTYEEALELGLIEALKLI